MKTKAYPLFGVRKFNASYLFALEVNGNRAKKKCETRNCFQKRQLLDLLHLNNAIGFCKKNQFDLMETFSPFFSIFVVALSLRFATDNEYESKNDLLFGSFQWVFTHSVAKTSFCNKSKNFCNTFTKVRPMNRWNARETIWLENSMLFSMGT